MSSSFEKARRLIREFKGHMPVPLAAEMVDEYMGAVLEGARERNLSWQGPPYSQRLAP